MSKETDYSKKTKIKVTEKVSTNGYGIFTLGTQNGKTFIAIGNQILSRETFDSEEEAVKYIDSKPWDLILNASCLLMEKIIEEKLKKQEEK